MVRAIVFDCFGVLANVQLTTSVPNQPLLDFIAAELKPRYKIGMLSNVSANWLQEMFTAPQLALFDAVALSYEMELTKPEPGAYRTIAERLGVQPDECVFIDDQEDYCVGAQEVGMPAIHYESFAQCKQALETLLRQPDAPGYR